MFYDEYLRLCAEKGVKPSRAADDAAVSRGTVSNWKKKRKAGIEIKPDTQTLIKLTEYFNVTADELLGVEQKEKPAIVSDSGQIPNYDKLNAANKAAIDRLIDDLVKGQSDD